MTDYYQVVRQVVAKRPWNCNQRELDEEIEELDQIMMTLHSPNVTNADYDAFQLECADVMNVAAYIGDADTVNTVGKLLYAGSYNANGIRGLCLTKIQMVNFRRRLQQSGVKISLEL